jgi:hypothetical protein
MSNIFKRGFRYALSFMLGNCVLDDGQLRNEGLKLCLEMRQEVTKMLELCQIAIDAIKGVDENSKYKDIGSEQLEMYTKQFEKWSLEGTNVDQYCTSVENDVYMTRDVYIKLIDMHVNIKKEAHRDRFINITTASEVQKMVRKQYEVVLPTEESHLESATPSVNGEGGTSVEEGEFQGEQKE